jgi:hypothetical protein
VHLINVSDLTYCPSHALYFLCIPAIQVLPLTIPQDRQP